MCGMSSALADIHTNACFSYLTTRLLSHPTALLPAWCAAVFYLFPFALPLWRFFSAGTPGDRVLLSSLTDWHGQNESSSSLPKARLCPQGALAGCISIRPAVLECTDCDGPWASPAPHWLRWVMQPCPAQTGLVNELDSTGRQLPERHLAMAWWIPAAYLPPSDSAPISPRWVKSKFITALDD